MDNSRRTTSIHVLDDNSLLHVFYLLRPFWGDEDGSADWRYNGHWWYAFAHVCRRWRSVIFGSAGYLSISLLCTYGKPIADMLARSPPLPLVVDYFRDDRELTTEDEEGITLALEQHDRVRRVRLQVGDAVTTMQEFFVTMDREYPILEYLYISRRKEDNSTISILPDLFQAPHLRHLTLGGFALQIGSRLLTTAAGLVTLHLAMIHPSTYFHPNTLIQWISLMPHLETLIIYFTFSIPNSDLERQLTLTPIIAPITLPNLHDFHFRGVGNYLEALVHRITAPRLEKLRIELFNRLTFSSLRLLQFINAAENFRLRNAVLSFSDKSVAAGVGYNGKTKPEYAIGIVVNCWHLDWQVSSMAQISNSLSQIFSAVEHLGLQHYVHNESSEESYEVGRTEWHNLLMPFSNVKTLRIMNGLVKDLSRCLQLEEGELPFELLPGLQELEYFGSGDAGGAFTSFIDARRNAGRPVTLVRL